MSKTTGPQVKALSPQPVHRNGATPDRAIAYTNWRFATAVNWCEFGQARIDTQASNRSTVADLIHEVSHKCGTTDAHRWVGRSVENAGGTPWTRIAASYESWALLGFCYPNVESEAFCSLSAGKSPKWMGEENGRIPKVVTESMQNFIAQKKSSYRALLDAKKISVDEYNWLVNGLD